MIYRSTVKSGGAIACSMVKVFGVQILQLFDFWNCTLCPRERCVSVHTAENLCLGFTCDGLMSYPSGNQWLSSTARNCSCDPQVHVVSIIWTLYMYLELERYDCVQPDRLSIKVHVQINSIYRCRIRVLSNFKKNRSK